ncbi:MAG: mannose-6-phosphate isomerase, class I [Saprospiraceae bacterium]|nr:mannose-6-phosphate isomerase, class I [Saprospiraceae bacterium]
MNSVYRLYPNIQHYAWGGNEYIPQWLGLPPDGQPYAEAWYGAHPTHPSNLLIEDGVIPLNDWIADHAAEALGQESVQKYGPRLPFLLKVLDVKDMLSIQLHPDKAGAMVGFEEENIKGIPLSASHRNYKDDNHKPELLIALSDFWMLQGFENLSVIKDRLESLVPGFLKQVSEISWQSLMAKIWSLEEDEKNEWCWQLQTQLAQAFIEDKKNIRYWLIKALNTYPPAEGNFDRGLLVMLMMHIHHLKPGEAGYQAPGVLHAYLEGQNVELMSNSDNVLRGGLTPKHIDAVELMKHLNTDSAGQCILDPMYLMDDEIVFSPPVPDFLIKQFIIQPGTKKLIQFNTASILLSQHGNLDLEEGNVLPEGDSLFIPAYKLLDVSSVDGMAKFFVATSII